MNWLQKRVVLHLILHWLGFITKEKTCALFLESPKLRTLIRALGLCPSRVRYMGMVQVLLKKMTEQLFTSSQHLLIDITLNFRYLNQELSNRA
ncbi:hypothetical protein GmHk_07G018503 [Glycine max]|nr:hypothetical protein GmHk_07G018503 [Glycine max]